MEEEKCMEKELDEVGEHHQTIEDNESSCQAPEFSHMDNYK